MPTHLAFPLGSRVHRTALFSPGIVYVSPSFRNTRFQATHMQCTFVGGLSLQQASFIESWCNHYSEPDGIAKWVEHPFPIFGDRGFRKQGFYPLSRQIDDLSIHTWCFLVTCSSLLGYMKFWWIQYQDNLPGWDIRFWCWQPGLLVGLNYNVAMNVHSDVRSCQ